MVSQSSASSSDESHGSGAYSEAYGSMCCCGFMCAVATSWSRDNPGRCYACCRSARGDDPGCGFEEWVDPPFPTRAISVINELNDSRDALLRSKIELLRSVDRKMVEVAQMERLSGELRAAFEEEKTLLEGRLKMQTVLFSLSVVVVLFAVVISCIKVVR